MPQLPRGRPRAENTTSAAAAERTKAIVGAYFALLKRPGEPAPIGDVAKKSRQRYAIVRRTLADIGLNLPSRGPPMRSALREKILALYREAGRRPALREAAKRFGVSHETIRQVLIQEGLSNRSRLPEAKLREAHAKGLTLEQASRALGVSPTTVSNQWRALGLPPLRRGRPPKKQP